VADLDTNLQSLVTAVQACRNRVDPQILARAQAVIDHAGRRLSLSRDATVIALAGATGSGKSSVFNAVTRTALAEPGIQRPMTQETMAVTFGDLDTSALLDWLQVSNRHIIPGADLDGVVLLDLVDHDSIYTEHQKEVDRLLDVVDQFFWVVDPQKYADAVLHDAYLRRFVEHESAMAFILNQIDRLTPEQAAQVRKDFLQLLRADGLVHPQVFEVSAVTGQGVDALRGYMAELVKSKQGMISRLKADVLLQARALASQVGTEKRVDMGRSSVMSVTQGCMEVAGVDQIAEAVRGSVTRSGRAATGWPWLKWVARFKPDPLKRLHLDRFLTGKSEEPPELVRTSIVVHPVTRARIDTVIREVSDGVGAKLPRGWKSALDRVIKRQAETLPEAVDQAVVATDLGVDVKRSWWSVVQVLQWIIFAITLVGLGWLAVNVVLSVFLQMPAIAAPKLGVLPLPTWMVIGGVAAGLILAGISRAGVAVSAKAAGLRAESRLRKAMEKVAIDQIIAPIDAELTRYRKAQEALAEITG